ncbi:hypothetical protein PR048_020455 [Dryococelus australis]|uniref:Major facilitator superfamily (MFS) profile domain-containing protein n=1 Tax=Dryococelus australis TaxID=614101 RepID=A0ABQ9H6D9_9NEOP|nr:hypothetical protein PR048_020455 [Dryococelus australis]
MGRLRVHQCVVFAGVWVLYAATYLLRKPLGVMKGDLGRDLSLSKLQLGCLDTAILLPYALVQMFCSRVADIISPRCTVTICLFFAGFSVLTFGSWSQYGVLLFLLAASGMMQAPVWPACCKCLSTWFSDDVLNTVFGLISTSVYGGSIIATALASYLYATYGWRLVFLPLAIMAMGLALTAWPVMRLPGDHGVVVPGKALVNINAPRSELSVAQLWCIPVVPQLSFAMLSLKLVRYTVYLWLPVYLMQGLGQSAATAGLLISLFDVGGIVGSMLLGFMADRHASLFHTWLAVVVSSFTFLAFLFTSSWGAGYNGVLLLVAGFCVCGPDSLLGGSVAVAVGEQDGKNSGAAVAGLINGFGSLGGVIEGPLVGYVSEAYSWNTMFLLVVFLLSASSFCILQAFLIQRKQSQVRYLPLHNGI